MTYIGSQQEENELVSLSEAAYRGVRGRHKQDTGTCAQIAVRPHSGAFGSTGHQALPDQLK